MKSNYMQQNLSSYASPHTSLADVAVANRFSEKNYIEKDYKNVQTTRIAISWQQAEKMPYFYTWDAVTTRLEKAREHGALPVWDLCCCGFPENLTPLQPNFARRFAAFCQSFVRYCKYKQPDTTLTIAAINETSFYGNRAYLTISQEARAVLIQACAQAISAMREEDPNICILANRPIADIIPLLGETSLAVDTLAIAS